MDLLLKPFKNCYNQANAMQIKLDMIDVFPLF